MPDATQEKAAPKRTRKKLDLATAKTADGALRAPQSVYEICGINDSRYPRVKNFDAYKVSLAKKDLIELHDECFRVGVPANPNRDITIDRLERAYLQSNSANRIPENHTSDQSNAPSDLRDQALKILARGR